MPDRIERALTTLFTVALAILCGCAKLPPGQSAVDAVTVDGTHAVAEADVSDKVATEASPKFLGVFRGVIYDYEIFDQATLQRDLARVERYYHARGYYGAHARAGRVMTTSKNHVRVEIVVEEGVPTVNDELDITGIDGLPADVQLAVRTAARAALPKGAPFDEDAYRKCAEDARHALTDRGYAYATAKSESYLDIVDHRANTKLAIVPGQTATFGAITIAGLDPDGNGPRVQTIPELPLRRAIDIDRGQPYSTARMADAKQSLLDLEVLSGVTITPDLSHPETRVVPLTVRVEPSNLRQVRLGGGVEFDELKTEVHALVGWEDHDFLGGLRDFSVDFTPGVVLYPTQVANLVAPDRAFLEEKLRLQLKQPGFLEAHTEGFIRPEVNVFPLLVQTNPSPLDPVVGYRELKGGVGLDRTFWRKLYVNLSYDAQVEVPFSYKGALDPALSTLVIAYPDLVTTLDFRDDHIEPHEGVYLSNDLQIAGGFLGGEARDVKVQPEIRTYIPLAKRVTFATRASIGFLFASNYGNVIENHLNDPVTPDNRAARVSDIETIFFRGFFSGGPTSNRGFPLRGVAPHGVVPFLSPATAAQQVALSCTPPTASNGYMQPDPSVCSIPIGGFTLWEFSNEVRFAIKGALSAATFCDLGDVSPHEGNIRLDHLHMSCGVGVRYLTPAGPIRIDVGYRIQPLQVLGYRNEAAAFNADPTNGVQPTVAGVPIALALGIGEAY